VGDHDAHPRVVDGVRADEREQGPDVGVRLAADVLPGPRSQRGAERRVIRVDVEVDGVRLGDAQQLRRPGDGVVPDLERLARERVRALVPVHRHELALEALPALLRVLVVDRLCPAEHRIPGRSRIGGPGGLQRRVGHEMAAAREIQREGQGARPSRRWRDHRDERADRVWEAEPELCALEGRGGRHGDREGDRFLEAALRGRGAEGDVGRANRERERRQQQRGNSDEGREDPHPDPEAAAAHCPDPHARPARRRMPVPVWAAPARPSRTSENDVP